MLTSEEIEKCYEEAGRLVIQAGKLIVEVFETEKLVENKDEAGVDLVTKYDREIEQTLVNSLMKIFPDHKFIGEEECAKCDTPPELTDSPTWIIDPIDGTTNFIHCFSQIGICVALSINKVIEFGIIYNPIMKQLFTGRRGEGATLNGKLLKTSSKNDISECLVGMEPWIAKDRTHRLSVYKKMDAVIKNTHGLRVIGSAAIMLCYVAMGAIEAYHVESIQPWDVAAAKVILEEAGGVILDVSGGQLDIMHPRVIAGCNRQIAEQLVHMFNETLSKPEDATVETLIKTSLSQHLK